ncbi:chaplin [Kitasatospora acidiphila]|uniref:chaplin n=1 Tax=Kitasatospora acidiphila TaxID=2567942 RepID=UPI003C73C2D6
MKDFRRALVLTCAAGALVLGGAGAASADATAEGAAIGSPGILSGNVVQIPIDIPINVCGNSLNVIGLLNPAFGNTCINGDINGREHDNDHDRDHHHHDHDHDHDHENDD